MQVKENEVSKKITRKTKVNKVENEANIKTIEKVDDETTKKIIKKVADEENIKTIEKVDDETTKKTIKKVEDEEKIINTTKKIEDDIEENIDEIKTEKLEKTDEKELNEEKENIPKQKRNIKYKIIFICLIFIIVAIVGLGILIKQGYFKNIEFFTPKISNLMLCEEKLKIGIDETINISTYNQLTKKQKNKIKWFSNDSNIVSIENGIVKGVGLGKTTIYAQIDNVKSNEVEIECIVKASTIQLDKSKFELQVKKEELISANILPEDTTYKNIIWKSSDENIAVVENGKVTGINPGKCIITATDITGTVKAECEVDIIEVKVEKITLDETKVKIGKGNKYKLVVAIEPENASYKEISWTSSNDEIISFENGEIIAKKEGIAKIIATSENGKTSTCTFEVVKEEPEHELRYSTGENYVTDFLDSDSKIETIHMNDILQVLNKSGEWLKVRTSNGNVGFIMSSKCSTKKVVLIQNVPFYNQYSLGYPTGCEAVSAAMVAKYMKYNVSILDIVNNTPTDERGIWEGTITIKKEIEVPIENNEQENENNEQENENGEQTENTEQENQNGEQTENNKQDATTIEIVEEVRSGIFAGNPFEVFVGHPTKNYNQGSYGCFAEPIVKALNALNVKNINISGCSREELLGYIDQGKPIVVWGTKNAKSIIYDKPWEYPDGSGSFTKLTGEHCMVLIGYDGEHVYLNDPSAGANVTQPIEKFFKNWNILYNQAILIEQK